MYTPTNEELAREIKHLWNAHRMLTGEYNKLIGYLDDGREINYDEHQMPDISPCFGDSNE